MKKRALREPIFALADVFADAVWRDFLAGMESTKKPKSAKRQTAEAKAVNRRIN